MVIIPLFRNADLSRDHFGFSATEQTVALCAQKSPRDIFERREKMGKFPPLCTNGYVVYSHKYADETWCTPSGYFGIAFFAAHYDIESPCVRRELISGNNNKSNNGIENNARICKNLFFGNLDFGILVRYVSVANIWVHG